MQYVLLMYGAAFIATGFGLGVQARAAAPGEALPRSALWAMTAFALVHGASDWTQLGVYLEQHEHGGLLGGLALVRLVLLALSFAILGTFGVVLALAGGRSGARRSAAAVVGPAAVLALWAIWGAVELVRRGGIVDADDIATAEAATRYLLGIPAGAAALVGLQRARRRIGAEEQWRTARYVGAASVAIAAYAFFTGLVVPAADLGLARSLNLASFAAVTRVPVELFRGASIAVTGLLLSEVFVRTTSEHLREEVEHLRDGFISLVAHDLKTPLNTVETGAVLLERLRKEEHASEREARILRAMRASVRAMDKIVTDLLEASRLQSRRLAIAPERLDLVPLLLRLAEWAPADAMRGHSVRLVAPGPLPRVLADPVRVEQVLANLLSNAGKYSAPGTQIVLEAHEGPREVTISVTNKGTGIPASELPHVFARQYRTQAARAGGAPGLGLGLYIARELVERQGGRIWAESEPGGRTTFSFTVPRAPADEAEQAPGARGAPRHPDDEPDLRGKRSSRSS